jgi:hypothetical protein
VSTSHAVPPYIPPSSLNERLALQLRNAASGLEYIAMHEIGQAPRHLERFAAELRGIAAQVERDLPSSYRKRRSSEPVGDPSEVSTQLAITPAIPMDEHCPVEPSETSFQTLKE